MNNKIKNIFSFDFYKYHFSCIFNIAEKNTKLRLRFKFQLVYSIVTPFFAIFMSFLILTRFLEIETRLGRWDNTNFYIFLFIAYNIELLRRTISEFPKDLILEKYWKTIPAIMIAPINKLHLLFGILVSHLIIISLPFAVFFIWAYLIYPISIFTFIFIIFIFLLVEIIFCGIGLFLGAFAISKENYWRIFDICIHIVFLFSCITYPFELFPDSIQRIILLNPLYYIFDILRITWLDNNILLTISKYPFHFIILIVMAITIPLIAIYIFTVIYNKYGIVGY